MAFLPGDTIPETPPQSSNTHNQSAQFVGEAFKDYRSLLIELEQKAQENYDKTILSLAGGALAISFAFVKDIVDLDSAISKSFLFSAWFSWGLSLTIVLISYYTSHLAFRHQIKQVDDSIRQADMTKLYERTPGGAFDLFTNILNAFAGVLFLTGVTLMIVFVWYNLKV